DGSARGTGRALSVTFRPAPLKVRFARDSPLEGDGFEPSVPRKFLWCPAPASQPTHRLSMGIEHHNKRASLPTEPMVRINLPPIPTQFAFRNPFRRDRAPLSRK